MWVEVVCKDGNVDFMRVRDMGWRSNIRGVRVRGWKRGGMGGEDGELIGRGRMRGGCKRV